MNIKKIELIWITVGNFERSKHFFTNTLGLKVSCATPEYNWLELQGIEGGTLLGVGTAHKDSTIKPGMNAVVSMTVDDIVAAKKELEDKGVTFVGDIIEIPGHVKMAQFTDPDGNNFQLVQQLQTC